MLHRWTKADLMVLADHEGVIRRGSLAVKIWPDGDITRWDTDLTLCNKMLVREVVQLLDLKPFELGSTITLD